LKDLEKPVLQLLAGAMASCAIFAIATSPGLAANSLDGKYGCVSYGSGSYNGRNVAGFAFYLTISGKTYKQTVADLPAGQFATDGQALSFTSGPYAGKWTAQTGVYANGRSRITLKPIATGGTVYCTHE
jgi:hypothetical protein